MDTAGGRVVNKELLSQPQSVTASPAAGQQAVAEQASAIQHRLVDAEAVSGDTVRTVEGAPPVSAAADTEQAALVLRERAAAVAAKRRNALDARASASGTSSPLPSQRSAAPTQQDPSPAAAAAAAAALTTSAAEARQETDVPQATHAPAACVSTHVALAEAVDAVVPLPAAGAKRKAVVWDLKPSKPAAETAALAKDSDGEESEAEEDVSGSAKKRVRPNAGFLGRVLNGMTRGNDRVVAANTSGAACQSASQAASKAVRTQLARNAGKADASVRKAVLSVAEQLRLAVCTSVLKEVATHYGYFLSVDADALGEPALQQVTEPATSGEREGDACGWAQPASQQESSAARAGTHAAMGVPAAAAPPSQQAPGRLPHQQPLHVRLEWLDDEELPDAVPACWSPVRRSPVRRSPDREEARPSMQQGNLPGGLAAAAFGAVGLGPKRARSQPPKGESCLAAPAATSTHGQASKAAELWDAGGHGLASRVMNQLMTPQPGGSATANGAGILASRLGNAGGARASSAGNVDSPAGAGRLVERLGPSSAACARSAEDIGSPASEAASQQQGGTMAKVSSPAGGGASQPKAGPKAKQAAGLQTWVGQRLLARKQSMEKGAGSHPLADADMQGADGDADPSTRSAIHTHWGEGAPAAASRHGCPTAGDRGCGKVGPQAGYEKVSTSGDLLQRTYALAGHAGHLDGAWGGAKIRAQRPGKSQGQGIGQQNASWQLAAAMQIPSARPEGSQQWLPQNVSLAAFGAAHGMADARGLSGTNPSMKKGAGFSIDGGRGGWVGSLRPHAANAAYRSAALGNSYISADWAGQIGGDNARPAADGSGLQANWLTPLHLLDSSFLAQQPPGPTNTEQPRGEWCELPTPFQAAAVDFDADVGLCEPTDLAMAKAMHLTDILMASSAPAALMIALGPAASAEDILQDGPHGRQANWALDDVALPCSRLPMRTPAMYATAAAAGYSVEEIRHDQLKVAAQHARWRAHKDQHARPPNVVFYRTGDTIESGAARPAAGPAIVSAIEHMPPLPNPPVFGGSPGSSSGGSATRSPKANKRAGRRRLSLDHINPDMLLEQGFFDMPIQDAAKQLNVGLSVLKRICRTMGLARWPYRTRLSLRGLIKKTEEYLDDNTAAVCGGPQKAEVVTALQAHLDTLKGTDGHKIADDVKKYRQSIFKLNHKIKKSKAAASTGKARLAAAPILAVHD
ncbi:hypothetical protein WJX72_007412 [[Myrmecia] bisecta]|uniref:RWP-RK domain-containing protein n=1 Tax=[Myrmecia] bisecta TaxID=41462 RepID=A0AAW1QRD4_9CHLO